MAQALWKDTGTICKELRVVPALYEALLGGT